MLLMSDAIAGGPADVARAKHTRLRQPRASLRCDTELFDHRPPRLLLGAHEFARLGRIHVPDIGGGAFEP